MAAFIFICFKLAFLFTTLKCCHGNPFQRWEIKLESGGYEDILIAINERVEETDKDAIFDSIKEYFADLSKSMFRATRNQLYIRNMTILVPQAWSGSYSAAGKEAFQYANILIDEANPATGNTPYVARSLPECGKPGDYMHLTPEYLKQGFRETYGEPGNVLLHEWAHLRWGLGDEYPHRDREERAFYYGVADLNSYFPTTAVKCNSGVEGRRVTIDEKGNLRPECENDLNTWLPNDACHFIPFERQSVNASIMYDQTVDSLSDFCDDGEGASQHNADAPNGHNILCDGKSAWAVFKDHPDFKDANPRQLSSQQLVPEYRFVQRKVTDRVVLVLDDSGSMGTVDPGAGASRVARLVSDASQYINNVISDGTSVGIIKFTTVATVIQPLTLINDARGEISRSLKMSANGGTCIGCGILEAIKMLETKGSASGGNIVLISDGKDGKATTFQEAQVALETKAVVLDAILYTSSADSKLISLARKSSGNVYFEDGGSTDLLQALIEAEDSRNDKSSIVAQQIFLDNLMINSKVTISVNFTIDNFVGNSTMMAFTLPAGISNDALQFSLHSPDGSIISDVSYNALARTVSMTVPGKAKSGIWTLTIENNLPTSITGQLVILSKPSNITDSTITAKAFLSGDTVAYNDESSLLLKIVAEVKKGYSPVLGATVAARLTASGSGFVKKLFLYDNGLGADGFKMDGYYTGMFVSYSANGKYSVKVDVSDANGDANVVVGASQGVYVHPDKQDFIHQRHEEKLGAFDRTTSGGFFTVQNYNGRDKFPPAQIKDLSLERINHRESTIQLDWTAMGEDFDQHGPATGYMLRSCESSRLLRTNFESCTEISDVDLIAGNLSVPLEPYARQSVTILLPDSMRNDTYFFALKVVDDDEQWSPLSNIVSAHLGKPTAVPGLSEITIILLGGAGVGIFIVIIICLCVVCCCLLTRRKSKRSKVRDAESKIGANYNNGFSKDGD